MKYEYKNTAPFDHWGRNCVARAISLATEISYEKVHATLIILGQLEGTDGKVREKGYCVRGRGNRSHPNRGISLEISKEYLMSLGWGYIVLPAGMLLDLLPHKDTIIIHFQGHMATAINGTLYDTWDSTRKRKIIGIYKKKET